VDLGAPELLIILLIALLIFGSNKLPKLARSLGQASREFKAGTTEGWLEDHVATPPPVRVAVEPPSSSAPSTGEPAQN
jgi:sec-independent protein translocase protein TatA